MADRSAGAVSSTQIDQGVIARAVLGFKFLFSGKSAEEFFGPGQPIAPAAQEQALGRAFDYQTGYNISTQPRSGEPVTFATLRGLADGHDLLRLAIETRKNQMVKLDFVIKPKDEKAESDDRCKKIQQFLESPDQEHDWDDWLRMWLEELFVTDAATIYPRRTKGSQLYALEHIDGATIKRVLSPDGRTPIPPDPAYQQVIKGIPAVDYTREELYYFPRNVRTSRIYGYSPVEQIIMTVNIALRRQVHQLNYYTEGNIPPMLAGVPATWNTDQIEKFQKMWDLMLTGDLAKRQKVRFVPGPVDTEMLQTEPLFDTADEWLARVICYAMDLPPTAFVKQQNRATAGTAQEAALEEGLAPIMRYVARKMTRMIGTSMDAPDLEFAWEDQKDIDPLVQTQIDDYNVKNGTKTVDEIREARGDQPLTAEQKAEQLAAKAPAFGDPNEDPNAPPGAKPKSKKGNPDGVTAAAAEKMEKFYGDVAALIAKTDGSYEQILARVSELELPAPVEKPDTRIADYAQLVEHGVPANKAAKHVGLAIDPIEGGDVAMLKASLIPLAIASSTDPIEPIQKSAPPTVRPVITAAPDVSVKAGDTNVYLTLENAKGGKRTISMTKANGEKVSADITETEE
jgi:hypothetical protein